MPEAGVRSRGCGPGRRRRSSGSNPASVRTVAGQGRRRRLAVGAGDRDALLQTHDLAEHLGAADHRDAPRAGGLDLGVGFLDRRGDDERGRRSRRGPGRVRPRSSPRAAPSRTVIPTAPGRNRRSRGASPAGGSRRCRSCRRRRRPRSGGGAGRRNLTLLFRPRTPGEPSSLAASGLARAFALRPMATSRSAVLEELGHVPGEVLRRESGFPDGHGRFALCEHARVGELMARRRRTEGHEDRRPAGGARAPRSVMAPARQTTRSAQAISSWSLGQEGTSFQFAGIRGYRCARRHEVLVARLMDHFEAGLLEEHARRAAIARLMTRDPWLPPKTRRRRVVAAGSSGGIAKNSGRTGVPVTVPGFWSRAFGAGTAHGRARREAIEKPVGSARNGVGLVDHASESRATARQTEPAPPRNRPRRRPRARCAS